MSRSKKLVLGLAGYGVVGTGFANALNENRDLIIRRTGRDIVIKTIAVRRSQHFAYPIPAGARLVHTLDPLLNDPAIDVVVELMGGLNPAHSLLSNALKAGKHVVTANKALLAENGADLFRLAGEKKLHLGYEASVCGGIPIVQAMRESLAGNKILSFSGIMNGTCNYILSAMSTEGQSFDAALKKAQDLGFAEADPTLDIEGFDAAHKLTLLIRLAWGLAYPFTKLPVHGITGVVSADIALAHELGYSIKLLGQAHLRQGGIEAGVFPTLVHDSLMLAKVSGSFNAIWVKGNAVGDIFMHGRGAGAMPTGSAVLSDVMAIARGGKPNNTGFASQELDMAGILDPAEAESQYYFRLMVPDRPGLMRDVAGVLADNAISIAQAIQKGEGGDTVPLVFMIHETKAAAVDAALKTMQAKGLLRAAPVCYRVLPGE